MAVHSACEPATGRESGVTGKGPGTFFAKWDYQLARALPVAKNVPGPLASRSHAFHTSEAKRRQRGPPGRLRIRYDVPEAPKLVPLSGVSAGREATSGLRRGYCAATIGLTGWRPVSG